MAPILEVPRPIVTDTSVADAVAVVDHPVIAEVAMPMIVIEEVADAILDHAADLPARAEDAVHVTVIAWSGTPVTRSVIVSMNVNGERKGCLTLKGSSQW